MKRIDALAGAIVSQILVGRNGTLHLHFKRPDDRNVWDWNPMIVQIPKEPKPRKRKK